MTMNMKAIISRVASTEEIRRQVGTALRCSALGSGCRSRRTSATAKLGGGSFSVVGDAHGHHFVQITTLSRMTALIT